MHFRLNSMRKHRALIAGSVMALGVAMIPAIASADLSGSKFEIDASSCSVVHNKQVCTGGANLIVNTAGNLDWANVANVNVPDKASGATDDSFGQGTSEDTQVPTIVNGSIPPQKSDLTDFSTYLEVTANGTKFLHMYWKRVQEPTGTTNMDFEFNKSLTLSSNGVTPIRSAGDLLLQYNLSSGGTHPELFLSKWRTSAADNLGVDYVNCVASNSFPCWAGEVDLSAAGIADGSINSSAITDANSDGLGPMSARTFGEASVNFSALAGGDCVSFGSVYLKSRASDSFNAETKDFVAPAPTNLNTCGKIIIVKKTIGGVGTFSFTSNTLGTIPDLTTTAPGDPGVSTEKGGLNPGTYDVAETGPPAGWTLTSATCSDGSPVNAIDLGDNETVTCTFVNTAKATLIVQKITDDGQGSFDYTSSTLSPANFTLTTTGAGAAGKDSRTYADILPGTYDVAETVPANWNLVSSACSDGSAVSSIGLSAGETVTCTFHNARERGAIDIYKLFKHAATGSGNQPQAGVEFTISGGDLSSPITTTTQADGHACVSGLLVSALAGNYTVTETVPAGYHNVDLAGATRSGVAVTESTCASGATSLTFHNMPLTNITVSVNSQVDGGTGSTIDCDLSTPAVDKTVPATAPDNGDGSYTKSNLEPGTYTCTIVIDP